MSENDVPAGTLTTLYNGSCPICRLEIGHYQSYCADRPLGLAWVDISSDEDWLKRLGLTREAAKRRLHVLDGDGRLLIGIDAFIALWQRMPRYRWLAWLIGSRAIRPIAACVYDRILAPALFAWNRRAGR